MAKLNKEDKEYQEIRTLFDEVREKVMSHEYHFRTYEVMDIIDGLAEKLEQKLVD